MTYARFPALGTGCVLMLLDLISICCRHRLSFIILPLVQPECCYAIGSSQVELFIVTRYSLLTEYSQPVGKWEKAMREDVQFKL